MTLARVEYREVTGSWVTPKGRRSTFTYREDTSDWNTISSCLTHDEYGLAERDLTGLAIDIGAYVGSVTIPLLLDNRDLRVVAVEALQENADLIARNAEANGVADRLTLICGAAASPDDKSADVFWRAQGTEMVEHHAFIGNSSLVYAHGDQNHETATVACYSLSALLGYGDAAFLKIDCEGCEWSFLTDPAISRVETIVGEWHPVNGHQREDVLGLLGATHDVEFSGPIEGPGGFTAVRR